MNCHYHEIRCQDTVRHRLLSLREMQAQRLLEAPMSISSVSYLGHYSSFFTRRQHGHYEGTQFMQSLAK